MTRCLLASSLAALLAASGPLDSALAHLSAVRMRADVAFLSSKSLAGRRSGLPGGEIAAEFLAAEMEKAGLRPAAGSNFLQTIPVVEFEVDAAASSLTLAGKTLPRAGNFTCNFPESVRLSARVVFAGYGITAPELGYDDYAGIDVRGKWALVLPGEPQRQNRDSIFNGPGDTIYAGPRLKILNAQQHGAAGVLLLPGPAPEAPRVTGSGGSPAAPRPSQALARSRLVIPLVTLLAPAAADLLPNRRELAEKIDSAGRPASFALPGAGVTLDHRISGSLPIPSANVAGWIEGSDPRLKAETIIVCAHHDHLGASGDAYFPGANDNASGAAAVLELARALAASGLRPRRSVLFLIFGSEEVGLLGSYYYVQNPLRPLASTAAVVNLDMIGRNETPSPQTDRGRWHIPADTSNALNPIGAHYSPGLRRAIESANAQAGLRLDFRLDADHTLNILQRCDHYPFLLERIPSVWLFTGFHPEYHQPTDTVDRLNLDKMLKIARLALQMIWDLANQDAAPKFVPNPGPVKDTA